jgi:hypothetical protein
MLERIEDAKAAQEEAEAKLAVLVDQAVILGVGNTVLRTVPAGDWVTSRGVVCEDGTA